jgi:hypothetical protein
MAIPFDNWQQQTATLNEDERDDPFSVLQFRFSHSSLFEERKEVWEVFNAAMGSQDREDDSPLEKSNLMYDCLKMIKLLEASFLIHKLIEQKKLIVQYKGS